MEQNLPKIASPTPPPTPDSLRKASSFESFHNPYVAISIAFVLLALMLYVAYLAGPMLKKPVPPQKSQQANQVPKGAPPIIPYQKYDAKLQAGPFRCPVQASLCRDPKNFGVQAIKVKLAADSPLYAAFDGSVRTLKSVHANDDGTVESFVTLLLANEQKGLLAYYSFKGKPEEIGDAQEGDKIAVVSGEGLNFEDGKSLVFMFQKYGEKEANQTISTKDFK